MMLRTHCTASQRATRAEGPRRKRAAKNCKNAVLDPAGNTEKSSQPAAVTVKEASREAGVSESWTYAARRLRRSAAPEVVQAVEAGRLTLHAAGATS